MKLKNRETGEIIETKPDRFVINSGEQIRQYDSLAELNEEWCDCEEAKYYYAITSIKEDEGITKMKNKHNDMTAVDKSIGNYFESRAEAEKAVKKLRAFKRLRDKGFVFCGTDCIDKNNVIYFEFGERPLMQKEADEADKDLAFLFGDEE